MRIDIFDIIFVIAVIGAIVASILGYGQVGMVLSALAGAVFLITLVMMFRRRALHNKKFPTKHDPSWQLPSDLED